MSNLGKLWFLIPSFGIHRFLNPSLSRQWEGFNVTLFLMDFTMIGLHDLHPEYITDQRGEKKSVILPISEFEELIEDIEDLAAVAERREEPTTSHQDLIAELKEDGSI